MVTVTRRKGNTRRKQVRRSFDLLSYILFIPCDVSAPDILKAIKWSENLNEIFIRNYQDDPSLSWQYFGSSSGFMRQYPGTLCFRDSETYSCVDTIVYIIHCKPLIIQLQ
jgi:uncharacterized protein with NRDE domain